MCYNCSRLCTLLCLIISFSICAQEPLNIASPNGKIVFSFSLINKSPVYSVYFNHKLLVEPSPLSLRFVDGIFTKNLELTNPILSDTTLDYELFAGKAKLVHTQYKQAVLPMVETKAPFRKLNFTVRVFDDGLAFRYEYLEQNNWSNYSLLEEQTSFKLTGDPMVHTLFLPNYTSSHEGIYSSLLLSQVKQDTLMDMPTLF